MKLRRSKVRKEGRDSHGMPVSLGEEDTDGFVVGYIDHEGLAWESREERDRAVGAARIEEEYFNVAKAGKLPSQTLEDVLDAALVLKENRYAACKEYIDHMVLSTLVKVVK